jgi:hypothetical protein
VATYLAAIAIAKELAPNEFRFRTERYEFVDDIPAIDLLVGSSEPRLAMDRGAAMEELIEMVSPVDATYGDVHMQAVQRVREMA